MRPTSNETGSTLVASIATAVVLAGLGVSLITVVRSGNLDIAQSRNDLQRLYLAESAARLSQNSLAVGGSGNFGSAANPVPMGAGAYWTRATKNADQTIDIIANGVYGGGTRAVHLTLLDAPTLFDNAIFAGNSAKDPNYAMHFGGVGAQGDQVSGDIFSGGDIEFVDDAKLDGTARASGKVTGITGEGGIQEPVPDLAAMNYPTIADVDVAMHLAGATATYASGTPGGKAWQLPESDAAHIFRKNPSDRASMTSSTSKDDFFLEDPYETMHTDPKSDGSDPYIVSLAGVAGKPGSDGNHKIYYVDGNLWINNPSAMSFQFASNDALALTIVVKGNIYIGDNIFYKDAQNDGLVLIAMKDGAVNDSGNIYFGDPAFGTLESMSAYMYAENNFYDSNLNATGSAIVKLHGMMSAGNQVAINRDYNGQHSRMMVTFDPRISTGTLALPGLPRSDQQGLTFLAWEPGALQH